MVKRASVPYRGRVRMRMHFRKSLLVLVLALVWLPPASAADTLHAVCGTRPRPGYPAATAPPVVQVWRATRLATSESSRLPECTGLRSRDFAVLVEVVGSAQYHGSADDLLARVGAISAWRDMRYWSVTDGRWQPWIIEATALVSRHVRQPRADFTVAELRSGHDLYFAQRDNRSAHAVVYRLQLDTREATRLVLSLENVSRVRLWFLTAFAAGDLQSAVVLERLAPTLWGYYSLAGIRPSALALEGHEQSYVQRALALYRHLLHVPTAQEPPRRQ
jgi:hypothetical protein